jgi:hypothetical protein
MCIQQNITTDYSRGINFLTHFLFTLINEVILISRQTNLRNGYFVDCLCIIVASQFIIKSPLSYLNNHVGIKIAIPFWYFFILSVSTWVLYMSCFVSSYLSMVFFLLLSDRGKCSYRALTLYVQWKVDTNNWAHSCRYLDGCWQIWGRFLHEALWSAARRTAYDPTIRNVVPRPPKFHFSASCLTRSSQEIPYWKIQAIPINKVSDPHQLG